MLSDRLNPKCELMLLTKLPPAHEGFEILAFPSNDFGNMEPGSNKKILEFARFKYKATFPIFAKVGGSLALETFRMSFFGDINSQFWSSIISQRACTIWMKLSYIIFLDIGLHIHQKSRHASIQPGFRVLSSWKFFQHATLCWCMLCDRLRWWGPTKRLYTSFSRLPKVVF